MRGTTAGQPRQCASAWTVFRAFLGLGLVSFGGPIAHLGYFRRQFVARLGWLDEAQFAQLLAVCQFLPGPASSQLGFAIGLFRAGWRGALAAFIAFTAPSALLLFAFAAAAPLIQSGIGLAVIHGFKLVAVSVVAHSLLGMARQLTPDLPRAALAVGACALLLFQTSALSQLLVIAVGALLGPWVCRRVPAQAFAVFPVNYGPKAALVALAVFALGLGTALAMTSPNPSLGSLAAAFYKAGALVFGGGHVVLPLLQQSTVASGWVSGDTFLAGYGAAQAVPGPMFSFSAFLGAQVPTGNPSAVGALVALLAVFVPGFLLLVAALPFWARLASAPGAARVVAGVNAVVVGLLAAAFYNPVWTQGVLTWTDFVIALIGFLLLTRVSALWVLVWCVAASVVRFALV